MVRSPTRTPLATTLTVSGDTSPAMYQSSARTYTAKVAGGTSPSGFVEFSYGNGLTTVPLVGGQASFTTPATLDAGMYTVTATYTGDPLNASSTDSTTLTVVPALTALALTPNTASTTAGTPVAFTATVACSPSCGGLTPTGQVAFVQEADGNLTTSVDLVNGQAAFTTDPSLPPGTNDQVEAMYMPFPDGPQDFTATSTAVPSSYDIAPAGGSGGSSGSGTPAATAPVTWCETGLPTSPYSSPPAGAVTIPAGDDSGTAPAENFTVQPNTIYWFAPGTHNVGSDQFAQFARPLAIRSSALQAP